MNTDKIRIISSAIFIFLLTCILAYLTYIPVPNGNKEIIITILGVLLGGAAAAMPNLFGDAAHDKEKELLLERIESLEKKYEVLQAEHFVLKSEYDKITSMLVQRHIIEAGSVIIREGSIVTKETKKVSRGKNET